VTEDLYSSIVGIVPDVIEAKGIFDADVVIDAEGEVVLCGSAAEDGSGEVVRAIDGR
jgi:hypothetical protein